MKKPRHLPLPNNKKDRLAEIMRVDHAGEYGAKRIYEGQLNITRGGALHKEIKDMYEQELTHLKYFETQLVQKRIRPTILQPLWHALGYALGAVTVLCGEKSAMACTVAVEDVIEEHYQSQIDELSNSNEDLELKEKIKQFRDEELEHRDRGIENKAKEAFGYKVLYNVVQTATKTAILLSKKI
ncbi:demethoxyubiquinone hydroxylase family protein [Holosporaceae bacterium 'Namur']|nr:demethoxyubiquinone hydroxylase family protein [Holosporaceae bacterium 'Namur']